jgi:KR domain/Phosphopantetheine attachment site
MDTAIALDELTASAGLSGFVLFSSASATFGAPGQGNYAAANAFLDALACQRQARGLPAVSIAWGLWEQATGMTAHLSGARRRRASGGAAPLSSGQGLALFDAALASSLPVTVAVNVDMAGLRAQAGAGVMAPLWRGLVRVPLNQQAVHPVADRLRQQLAGLPEARQQQLVLDLVREQAAAVLGHSTPNPVRQGAAFRELGFDSLAAIELRNRLSVLAGLRLPATLVFDHPSPAALASWLWSAVSDHRGPAPVAASPVLAEIATLETMLSVTTVEDIEPDQITARLEAVLSKWKTLHAPVDADAADRELLSATAENIFNIIDEEFGVIRDNRENAQ